MEMRGETHINGSRMDKIDIPNQMIEFKLEDKITFGAQKSGVTIQFRMTSDSVQRAFFYFLFPFVHYFFGY